jgi:STE24 endopeptidase
MNRILAISLPVMILLGAPARADEPPAAPAAAAPEPAPAAAPFNVDAAVEAYLASVPADARAKSDAYFEGGYWLILVDFLVGAIVALLMLATRLSSKMRNLAERITRRKPLQTALYWVGYLLVTTVATFPFSVYEGFCREKKYDLMNQGFGEWLGDQAIGVAVGLILGGLLVTVLFGIARRLPQTWWMWGAGVTVVFFAFTMVISPVFIAPLFNKYTKLTDAAVRDPILAMARANGIPAVDVWQVDASRQSKRVSANVSGFFGTERITLNDNLLRRCSLPEIEAVMGHEMGHYVLNHVYKGTLFFSVEAFIFFAFLSWALRRSLARWGARWDIRGIGDTAVLPLVVLLASVFFLVLTPVNNSYTRAEEYEADIFGLNASGQPDGEAKVDLLLGEYRKLDPGWLEEVVFFDHPSGRTRITAAMRWKAEHLR